MFLSPEQAETESGDLLEAYRDSIFPTRGPWRADLWYARQVVGYILRARGMKLRNWLLAGLALCVVTTAVSMILYPELLSAWVIEAGGFLFYGYVVLWRTRPVTPEDAAVLRLGTSYGIAIGVLWLVGVVGLNLRVGMGFFPVILSYALPLVAGVHGGVRLWRVRAGMRVGFWSGLISGVVAFLGCMVFGYILAFVPGLPGAEIPAYHPYTAVEYQQENVADSLGGGSFQLFVFGGIFSVIGGTVGGLAGILLARTGRGAGEARRLLWSLLAFCILGTSILSAHSMPLQSPPAFEVASIRVNKTGNVEPDFHPVAGGRLTVNNVTLKTLIITAWHLQDSQISGGPGWIDSDRFDINAKAEGNVSLQEALQMLQTLLKDRFKLVFHRETRDVPAFKLSVLSASRTPNLTPSQGGESGLRATPVDGQKGIVQVTAKNMTMQHLADILGSQLHAPIAESTGLTGSFDFTFSVEVESDAAMPAASAISNAFRDQLGLAFESIKAPAEFFVIESVDRPTEN
jgi:uncharacterized protein (TIGR03435 family)